MHAYHNHNIAIRVLNSVTGANNELPLLLLFPIQRIDYSEDTSGWVHFEFAIVSFYNCVGYGANRVRIGGFQNGNLLPNMGIFWNRDSRRLRRRPDWWTVVLIQNLDSYLWHQKNI